MIRAIILDFDGVIVESVDIKTQAFRELFSRYTDDIEPIVNYHLQNNGVSRFIKFKHIWEKMLHRNYDVTIQEKLGEEFSSIVINKVIDCPFVVGALDFLRGFYKVIPLYIASAVPEEELATIVEARGIGGYFARVYGFPPNTKSQAMFDVMARESISANEILYIGDSLEDLRAAAEAGTLFIARRNREDFERASVPIFDDMNGVMNYIKENLKV